MPRYSEERKEAVLRKMLPPNNRALSEPAVEEGNGLTQPAKTKAPGYYRIKFPAMIAYLVAGKLTNLPALSLNLPAAAKASL